MKYSDIIATVWCIRDERGLTGKRSQLTDMYVPGKKASVTSVITLMDTVSVLVLLARSFISRAIRSMFIIETLDWQARYLLVSLFCQSRTP